MNYINHTVCHEAYLCTVYAFIFALHKSIGLFTCRFYSISLLFDNLNQECKCKWTVNCIKEVSSFYIIGWMWLVFLNFKVGYGVKAENVTFLEFLWLSV